MTRQYFQKRLSSFMQIQKHDKECQKKKKVYIVEIDLSKIAREEMFPLITGFFFFSNIKNINLNKFS